MRRYRIDAKGHEQPVWASRSKITELGRQEGQDAFNQNRLPIHYGNLTYDNAAQAEYQAMARASNPASPTAKATSKPRKTPRQLVEELRQDARNDLDSVFNRYPSESQREDLTFAQGRVAALNDALQALAAEGYE